MPARRSRKYSQGYGTVLVALIGAAGVAGSIGYEARLQGQTGERNESLKGYLQARELASERVMMMLSALEKAAVTPITLQGVNAASADMAIVQNSPKSLAELSSQSGVNFSSLGQQLDAEVQFSSGWRNASLDLNTQMLGATPRLLRDSHGIPVNLEYTLRVKGKGYYFCPSAGSKSGCATGEAAADLRWKVPLQVAALPVLPPSVTPPPVTPPSVTPPAVTPPPTSSGPSSGGGATDPCAAHSPQASSPNTTSASSTSIASNTGTLTCTSGNVGVGGSISVLGNANNGQGTSNTQGSATHGSNNIVSTTTGNGSYASNTTTNGNGTQTQSSGNAANVHNVPAAVSTPAPVVGSSSGKYYQATLGGLHGNRALHPWEQ